jgi:hypothetical protein
MLRRRSALPLLGALALAGCATAGVHRFPLRAPLWVDPDRQPFAPPPAPRDVPYFWDSMDNLVFRPAVQLFAFELSRPAINVNALDEVPDSSWFENRIGRHPMSPEAVARGACGARAIDAPGPWTVTGGKPSGRSPGFFIRDADGVRWVLKTDRAGDPQQATAADAIVAALFHAAGYHVPCNRVVFFEPGIFVLGEGARGADPGGEERPLTEADLRAVTEAAAPAPDGRRRRVLLSRFVEGEPLGPWSYRGTREGDPNDVVPHEHRRDLRGTYVLNAWVDHWDVKQQNTLSTWIEAGRGGYVRHYLLDFGESMGLVEGNHRESPRFGHTAWLDIPDVVQDVLTLGLVRRPWHGRGPPAEVLGYFDAAHFDPDRWHPLYWNGALERRTEGDTAWMARILARFSDAHVAAAVRLGRYHHPRVERRALAILLRRRDLLLERYLTRRSPLSDPSLARTADGAPRVCLTDLAIEAGLRGPHLRRYRATLHRGPALAAEPRPVRAEGARVCVDLPHVSGRGRPADYLILDVVAATEGAETTGPARLHFYATGPGALRLVGLERPPRRADPPRP